MDTSPNSVSDYESLEEERRSQLSTCSYDGRRSATFTSGTFTNPGHTMPFELFICSEAGKPVYFYNKSLDDEFVVTLVGVIQAMVNFYKDANNDELKCINTLAGLRVTFCIKSPLIFVLVTEKLSPIDPSLVINQVFACVVSILTFQTLRKVFIEKPSFDLRLLLAGSEKVIDTLIDEGLKKNPLSISKRVTISKTVNKSMPFHVSGYLTSMPTAASVAPTATSMSSSPTGRTVHRTTHRALIPVMPLSSSLRDSLTTALASSISSVSSSIIFALLLHRKTERSVTPTKSTCDASGSSGLLEILPSTSLELDSCQLISIHSQCPKKAKLNPLDVQLISSLVISSEGQLASAESLWLPICVPRVDTDGFFHAHISYISVPLDQTSASSSSSRDKTCLILLATNKEDFDRCQHIKANFSEKLLKSRIQPASFPDVNIPFLQSMVYYSTAKPTAVIYRNYPYIPFTNFKKLINYLPHRMASGPNFKTFWLHSDDQQVTLLGWSSSSFTIYFQFDATVGHGEALSAASTALKWIKREEEKFKLRDYQ